MFGASRINGLAKVLATGYVGGPITATGGFDRTGSFKQFS